MFQGRHRERQNGIPHSAGIQLEGIQVANPFHLVCLHLGEREQRRETGDRDSWDNATPPKCPFLQGACTCAWGREGHGTGILG